MEVILLERINRLGGIGDMVRVKDGFARNFLLPRQKALRATDANRATFEARRADIEAENATRRKEAEKQSKKLTGMTLTVVQSASEDGKLYGSVSARDIAVRLSETASGVERQHVLMNAPLKQLGTYSITIAMHPDVTVQVPVIVARSDAEAAEMLRQQSSAAAAAAQAPAADAA